MKNYSEKKSSLSLFSGMDIEEETRVALCLGGRRKTYEKGETVAHAGEQLNKIGLVVTGAVTVSRFDVWGNRNILEKVEAGETFGESFALAENEPLTVSLEAANDTEVLWLDIGRLFGVCGNACVNHLKVIENVVRLLAGRNIALNTKMSFLTFKSIRSRILSYLSMQQARTGKNEFEIPYNRQELADFLAVDRSALSNELSKMQKDGLIVCQKNRFRLCAEL